MALITKPTNIYQEYENVYQLDTAELLSHPKISPDQYFNNQNNWKTVFLVYEAPNSNQREMVEFLVSEGSSTGTFEVTEYSRLSYQVKALIIEDFDSGYIRLEREDIDFASLDINVLLPPPIVGIPVLTFVGISSDNVNPAIANVGDVITINFNSNEVLQNVSAIISGQTASISGSGTSWSASYMLTGVELEGLVNFAIDFQDTQNEQGTTVTSTTNQSSCTIEYNEVTLDTVTIIASNNSPTNKAVAGSNILVSFTSSDIIQNIISTIAGQPASVVNIINNSYTANYVMTGSEPQGNIEFTIDYEDQLGNPQTQVTTTNTTSQDTEVIFDSVLPTLTSVSISSNNTNTQVAEVGDIVSIYFTSDEPIQNVLVDMANNSADIVINTSGNNWRADYTIQSGDSAGVIQFLIDFEDGHGNSGIQVNSITTGTDVTI